MADAVTNKLKYLLGTGAISTATDIRMGLLSTMAGTTNVADINFITDMESHADFAELTGASGYARVALSSKTVTEDDANDWALWDSADVSFGSLATGGTIVGYFLFKYDASDAAAEVLQIGSLTSTPTNGGTFSVTTPNGLFKLS